LLKEATSNLSPTTKTSFTQNKLIWAFSDKVKVFRIRSQKWKGAEVEMRHLTTRVMISNNNNQTLLSERKICLGLLSTYFVHNYTPHNPFKLVKRVLVDWIIWLFCDLNIVQSPILNVIILGQAISDHNNKLITLSELPFPLNKASFRKQDLLKQPKLMILSMIPLSNTHSYFNLLSDTKNP